MDPAQPNSPQNRFERIDSVLQRQEAQMTSAATEARQSAETHEQTLTALAAQVQQLTAVLTLATTPGHPPVHPPVDQF